jgi:hypothetical protein
MGGFGSGRQEMGRDRKFPDEFFRLDIRCCHREGVLKAGNQFVMKWSRAGKEVASIEVEVRADDLVLSYRHKKADGGWTEIRSPIRLDWTRCPFGGSRPWLICPSPTCERRVAILYGKELFLCRQCQKLVYESQYELADARAFRKVERLQQRFGWAPGFFFGAGERPKGMHHQTFVRRHEEYETAFKEAKVLVDDSLALLNWLSTHPC